MAPGSLTGTARIAALRRAAEVDLRTTIDVLPTLHLRCLTDGSAEFLNQTWLDYTGYTMEQGCGWGWQSALHPDDVPRLRHTWKQLLESGEPGEDEARLRRHDGQYRWFLFQARSLRDNTGKIVLWCGTNLDIDDRKFADGLLAGEIRVLEMIARGVPLSQILAQLCRHADEMSSDSVTAIWLLDPSDNTLRYAASANLPPDLVAAMRGTFVDPNDGRCGTSLARAESVVVTDIASDPLFHKWGNVLLSNGLKSCVFTPILTSSDSVLGIFAVFSKMQGTPTLRDSRISQQVSHLASIAIERGRTEAALQRTRDELAHVTRITTLGELAASIAHEVNQPLSAIGTHGEAGLRWLSRGAPVVERARQTFEQIVRDASRAGEILRRIRDLSKKVGSEKMLLDVNGVIGDVIPLLQSEATSHRSILRMELSSGLPSALGDRVQLQQVIINLVINGIESMESVTQRPRELAIQSRLHEGDQVLVSVRDGGAGIDPANSDRLFQAFFTTKSAGMGMGLSIFRSIMEAHGGRIWARENDDALGTTFNLVLPIARGA